MSKSIFRATPRTQLFIYVWWNAAGPSRRLKSGWQTSLQTKYNWFSDYSRAALQSHWLKCSTERFKAPTIVFKREAERRSAGESVTKIWMISYKGLAVAWILRRDTYLRWAVSRVAKYNIAYYLQRRPSSWKLAVASLGRQFFLWKKGWHHQLPPRVTPTLVMPLKIGPLLPLDLAKLAI